MPERLVQLKAQPANERTKVQAQGARRWSRPTFNGIKPGTVSGIITQLEQGDTERWVDLCEFMLRDPHVRSVETTRMTAIIGSEIVVEPGIAQAGQEEIAEQAAQDFREELESTDELESLLTAMLHAENVGWAGAEHSWKRVDGRWHSDPWPIAARDIKFRNDWVPLVRTYPDEQRSKYEILTSSDYPASRWLWHIPRKLGTPTTSGDFLAIVWHWLFKRWAVLFRNEGLEAFANPFRVGKVPAGAPLEVRQAMEAALENQSNNHFVVVEEGTDIELIQPAGTAGDAWNEAIRHLHDEITKSQLGSTLNVEVGTTGGNRALGESQFSTTILPRLSAMAHRLATSIERQWAKPWTRFNAHLYGHQVPPCPKLRFKLVNDEQRVITPELIMAEAVTVDELREAANLTPWGPERGGDRVASIQSAPGPAAAPMASAATSPGGGPGEPDPFALALRPKRPTRATTGTSYACRSQIGRVPFEPSDGPAR